MTGIIIKGIGGFYYISAESKIYECRARGKLRLNAMTPLAGDRVMFDPGTGSSYGYLIDVLPRKNSLIRPPVANVDQFVMILSASTPKPDFLLCDKLLLQAQRQAVDSLIVLNKSDIADDDVMDTLKTDYSASQYTSLIVSAKTLVGLEELKNHLRGKLSCFAGQSAVGKSSLINSLCTAFDLPTGELSRKTGRGKHTTRVAELLDMDSEGYIVDTPGFSLLDVDDIEPEELQLYYPEMRSTKDLCRFANCLHDKEPDCAVKMAIERGELSTGRHERYLSILEELKKKKEKKYD